MNLKKCPQDKHVTTVIKRFKQRSELGMAKYGTNLDFNDSCSPKQ